MAIPPDSGGRAEADASERSTAPPITAKGEANLSFLSDAQKATGAKEYARLVAIGAAPNYLCREVISWAVKQPTDQRVGAQEEAENKDDEPEVEPEPQRCARERDHAVPGKVQHLGQRELGFARHARRPEGQNPGAQPDASRG